MPTVNFQCGACNNLMAVDADHLGQQVRCPHCQTVVVAPTTAPPPPAPADAPTALAPVPFGPPTVNEQEDIFAPPEPSDDLFGQPDPPRVEMPPSAPPQPPPVFFLDGPVHPAPPAEPVGSTLTYSAPEPTAPPGDAALPAWMHSPEPSAPSPAGPTGEAADPLAHGDALTSLVRKPRDNGGWFIGLVFIPLLSYSVLATILAGYLFYRLSQEATPPPPPSPLEKLPAFDPSDEHHSTHLKLDSNKLNRASGVDVRAPLPPNQIIRLGDKLRLGDLEIEPLRVDREVVAVMTPGVRDEKPEPCAYPSLVLTLRLHNVSNNVVFQPMDSYFNRNWDQKSDPPLTLLELLGKDPPDRFYGGPAPYAPPAKGGSDWVVRPEKGPDLTNRTAEVLNPGEEKEFFVCTDGGKTTDDKQAQAAAAAIDAHHGKLLWRVHLRRGLEVVNAHRYVPISTVIGVEFTDQDYRKSS